MARPALTGGLCAHRHRRCRCDSLPRSPIRSTPRPDPIARTAHFQIDNGALPVRGSVEGERRRAPRRGAGAARARPGHAGVGDVTTGGVSDYGLIGGGGELEVEEAAGGGVAAGGTPVRPIWQRRVLMGVKCQLPRFSGMILYDERGRPECGGVRDRARDQEKHAAAITVLREML